MNLVGTTCDHISEKVVHIAEGISTSSISDKFCSQTSIVCCFIPSDSQFDDILSWRNVKKHSIYLPKRCLEHLFNELDARLPLKHKDHSSVMFVEKLFLGYNSFLETMAFKRKPMSFWIYTCLLIALAVGADARRNEESPPRITEHPSSQSVRKNSPATLNCRAEGYPTPDLHWLKDGQPLEMKGDGHLTALSTGALFFLRVIPRVDIGVYQCVATNSLGVAYSNNATLDIAYLRGDFRQEPSDTMALLGEAVVLECSPPRGHPEPEVSWERNGETVVEDGVRVRILTDGNLVISQPKSSDIGNYVCLATNSEGTKRSAPGRLIINSRPAFTAVPFDKLAIPGETITLPCVAEGEPAPTIRWVKEDGSLPQNRNTILDDNTLRITNAETSDSGTYICTAQNQWGEKSVEAIVTVSSAPMFTRVPVDRTVVVGQDAFFLCQATGLPTPGIYWKERGAKPLMFPGDRTEHYEVTNDGRLHLFSVTRENEGYYVCSAMSGRGSVEDSAYLRVLDGNLPLPPIIHIGPSNQTLVEGSPAQLVCQAEGSQPPSIEWLKDGAGLQLVGTRVTMDGSGTLKFSSLTPDDAGHYTCSAANSVGATRWSASLQVIRRAFAESEPVHEAPSVTQLPQAPGFPIVDNITKTTMRLTWPSARPLKDRTVSLTGYRVEYFTPDHSFTGWTVAAESIQGNSFEVRNLDSGFSYVFMVRGINEHGYGPPSPVSIAANTLTAIHRDPPGPNAKPGVTTQATEGPITRDILQDKLDNCGVYIKRVQVLGSTAINVTWQIVRNGDYIDGYYLKVTPQVKTPDIFEMNRVVNDKTAVQGGLHPWTEYGITVEPYHGGWHRGRGSRKVVIRTAQDVPKAPPTSIKARQNGSTSIKVSWRPPPTNQVPGIIAGYHVFCLSENPPHHPNITIKNNRTLEIAVANLRPGAQYGVKVAAYTIAGMGPFSDIVYVTLPPGPDDPEKRGGNQDTDVGGGMDILSEPWFYAAVALALLFVITSIFLLFWRRHKKKPCSPVGNVMISKDNVTVQNMAARPTQLNGTAHPEGETTWTSSGPPHSHNHQGCMGNCCTGNGSSGDDTLEKNKPPPSKWPNGAPPVWLQEVYNPKYPSHLQSQVSKETHLTHDSQSSSGFGSSFPTLSTFHGMMMHPSSPEYAVVENEAEMDEELSVHAGSTLPIIPSPGSGRPPPQYNQHLHFPHHQMSDDPEPYASATLVQPPNMREYPARRQNCSDNSSEWSGSWQSSNRDGRRPGRMVKPGGHGSGHGSPRGWHAPYDGPPAVPDRDMGYSDQGSQYSRCSAASKRCRHPHATTPGRQPQRNWAEFLPPPPEQPPTDMDSPGGSLPSSHPGSIKSSFYRRGSSPNQHAQAYVQINPGACEDCEAAAHQQQQCPPVPPRHHQQSPLLNQPLSGNNSPVPIYPPPLLPQQPCRTEIPGPGSHFQPISSSLSPPPGDSPSHKRGMHKLNKTPPPVPNTTTTGSTCMTPEFGGNTKQTVIPLQSGPTSPGRGSQQMQQQSIASQRVFEDPRHAQIGQELLKYMTRNELEAMSEDAPYEPMEMTLKNTEGSNSAVHPSLSEIETTELNSLDSKERDMDTASNCTGSMLAYGSSSNGSRRNSNVSTSSDGSFFAETDFASAVAAAAQNAGMSVMQRDTPLSSQHLLREDTV